MVDQVKSKQTRAGLKRARASGKRLGRPPGSDVPAKIRRRIARERQQGRSLRQIAAGLDRDGVAPVHGGRQWWASSVRAVLEHERATKDP